MQIKTGLAIGTGVIIGSFIGMCVSEDTKFKWINRGKKKLIYLMTGEDWNPPKSNRKPMPYTTYKDYTESKEKIWKRLLSFETEAEARSFLENKLRDHAKIYGSVSLIDLCSLLRIDICDFGLDYTYDNYGWTKKQIDIAAIVKDHSAYRIVINNDNLMYLK